MCDVEYDCFKDWGSVLPVPCLVTFVFPVLPAISLVALCLINTCSQNRGDIRSYEVRPWDLRASLTACISCIALGTQAFAVAECLSRSRRRLAATYIVSTSSLLLSVVLQLPRWALIRLSVWVDFSDVVTGYNTIHAVVLGVKSFNTISALWDSPGSCWVSAVPEVAILGELAAALLLAAAVVIQSLPRGQPPIKVCPEQSASLLSRLFFHWFTAFAWGSRRNDIDLDSLWAVSDEFRAEVESRAFQQNLHREFPTGKPKCRENGARGSTRRALVRTFVGYFLVATLWKFFHDCFQFAPPLLMKAILRFLKAPDEPVWVGISYALAMLLCNIIQTCFAHAYFHRIFKLIMRVHTVLVSAVYKKSLVLSSVARREKTIGEIVNLMSNDTQKVVDILRTLNMVWSAPFQITTSIVLIYMDLGPAVFAGLLFMIILLPISGVLGGMLKKSQMIQMRDKDRRLKIMNEILNGMKVLKLYAWELGFKKVVDAIRYHELGQLRKIAIIQAFLTLVWFLAPFMVSLVTFGTYVLLSPENRLTSEKAFVSLALFQMLRAPLAMLPNLVTGLVQVGVSLKRLDNFMSADELDPYVTHNVDDECDIRIQNASFSWEDLLETESLETSLNETPERNGKYPAEVEYKLPCILNDISFSVAKGELVAVVGQVGQGKSSLVSAVLGEMCKISGTVNVTGRIAYVPQQAWLRNTTLRENILFGKPYVHQRYWDVIQRCALVEDIRILPAGDQTEIGEKGINLSGGQKQRISIARAVYADADIYLLDDPLSAVDPHVGSHIFSKVISDEGILQSKTRVLVTHGIHYLPKVDRVFVIKDGSITHAGTYKELIDTQVEFRNLIRQFSEQEQQAETETGQETDPVSDTEALLRSESVVSQSAILKGKIVEKERTETGRVKSGVYSEYLEQVGRMAFLFVVGTMFISMSFQVGSSFWLAEWANDKSTENATWRLEIYGLLGLGQGLGLFTGVLSLVSSTLRGGRRLHDKLFMSILRSPMSFFDSTPIGRIVNRFARDIDVVDLVMSQTIRVWLQQLLQLISIIFVICFNVPVFVIIVVPIIILYYLIQLIYISASRQLKRLESITSSPIFSHFGETLQGTSVIRAYGACQKFIDESNDKVDVNHTCFYPKICANRWLGVRLDLCAALIVFFTAFLVVLTRADWKEGIAGLCLSYALTATGTLSAFIRATCDVEVDIVSVERIIEYMRLTNEAEWEKNPPKESWPDQGVVEFKNYSTQYRPGLPLVVKDVNVRIEPGEKVGVVGRTGAGKSSLTVALFRIIEAVEGNIFIDYIDISTIGLHDLRKRLSIIPQDPILFSGPMRLNLDPFNVHSDAELWHAIEHAHLKTFLQQQEKGLDLEVTEGGENLSVGQRQLVCLARALLRNSKIIVLDEATAAVDVETDAMIQETIRQEFSKCTILTIAHRINTIINYDKILVLDAGEVKEFDSPEVLLDNADSLFRAIVEESKAQKKN